MTEHVIPRRVWVRQEDVKWDKELAREVIEDNNWDRELAEMVMDIRESNESLET